MIFDIILIIVGEKKNNNNNDTIKITTITKNKDSILDFHFYLKRDKTVYDLII